MCRAHKYDHVTALFQELLWLSISEHIKYALAVLVSQCWHSMTSEYLTRYNELVTSTATSISDRYSSSLQITMPMTRLYIVSDRAFGVAAARIRTVTSVATVK